MRLRTLNSTIRARQVPRGVARRPGNVALTLGMKRGYHAARSLDLSAQIRLRRSNDGRRNRALRVALLHQQRGALAHVAEQVALLHVLGR